MLDIDLNKIQLQVLKRLIQQLSPCKLENCASFENISRCPQQPLERKYIPDLNIVGILKEHDVCPKGDYLLNRVLICAFENLYLKEVGITLILSQLTEDNSRREYLAYGKFLGDCCAVDDIEPIIQGFIAFQGPRFPLLDSFLRTILVQGDKAKIQAAYKT